MPERRIRYLLRMKSDAPYLSLIHIYATVLYESVCASGPVWIVEEETEKREALDLILRHYGGQLTEDFGSPARTAVFALRCDTLTGKRNP